MQADTIKEAFQDRDKVGIDRLDERLASLHTEADHLWQAQRKAQRIRYQARLKIQNILASFGDPGWEIKAARLPLAAEETPPALLRFGSHLWQKGGHTRGIFLLSLWLERAACRRVLMTWNPGATEVNSVALSLRYCDRAEQMLEQATRI
jgi:hypothetical protein